MDKWICHRICDSTGPAFLKTADAFLGMLINGVNNLTVESNNRDGFAPLPDPNGPDCSDLAVMDPLNHDGMIHARA